MELINPEESRDDFKLSTGRTFYANCGIIGIGPSSEAIYEGYDGGIDEADINPPTYHQPWTKEERLELADEMIARWWAYREKAKSAPPQELQGYAEYP